MRSFTGLFRNENAKFHTITLMFTSHYLSSRANGPLIAPITFTDSLQTREEWPLRAYHSTKKCLPYQLFSRGRNLNTFCFYKNSGTSGISRAKSRQKVWSRWVSKDIPNFFAPAPSREINPPPPRRYPDQKLWVWVPFSSLIWGCASGQASRNHLPRHSRVPEIT